MGPTAAALDCRSDAEALVLGLLHIQRTRQGAIEVRRRRTILTRTVEREVIPRLLQAHGLTQERTPARADCAVTQGHVVRLVELALGPTDPATAGFVTGMQDEGVAAEALYLDLLAPAAVRLGDMWADDLCSFADVTIGLVRLRQAMHAIAPGFLAAHMAEPGRQPAKRALLVPLPGEQHTFGLAMVLDFFRRAGWAVCSPAASSFELATILRSEWIDVLGLSLACNERLDDVRGEIRRLRAASRNPAIAVLVGGPCFVQVPGLAAQVGADGTARDGRAAVTAAQDLVQRQSERLG